MGVGGAASKLRDPVSRMHARGLADGRGVIALGRAAQETMLEVEPVDLLYITRQGIGQAYGAHPACDQGRWLGLGHRASRAPPPGETRETEA